jgi:hypothetical protein
MMQTLRPKVDFCLLCEDIRPEPGNKLSILGFFGLLPRARIVLKEWGKSMEKVCFLVSTHGGAGTFKIHANILNPDGSLLISSAALTGEPPPETSMNSAFVFAFGLIVFKEQGEQYLQVMINDEEAYRSSFVVIQGPVPNLGTR